MEHQITSQIIRIQIFFPHQSIFDLEPISKEIKTNLIRHCDIENGKP